MNELRLTAPGKLSWQQTKEPVLTSLGALVRPLAVSTCDFDHLLCSGRSGLPIPLTIGHECVAEVLAIGTEVTSISVGERVSVSFQVNCGTCRQCQAGRSSSCEAVPWLSSFGLGLASGNWGGAMSDMLAIPFADAMLTNLPAELSTAGATCLSCNMPDAYRCVAPQLTRNPEAPVLIVAGAFDNIALYSAGIATSLGASQVDVYGVHPSARSKVEAMGARVLLSENEIAANHYPITVDASMDPQKLALAVQASAPAGELTLSTMYNTKTTDLPLMQMFEKCLSMATGQPDVRSLIKPVLQLLVAEQDKFGLLIDEVQPWQAAPSVFSHGLGKQVVIRD